MPGQFLYPLAEHNRQSVKMPFCVRLIIFFLSILLKVPLNTTFVEYVKQGYTIKRPEVLSYKEVKKDKIKIGKNEIAFAQITNFSGQQSIYAKQIYCGIAAHFMAVNENGGVCNKHPLRLIVADDQGDPILTNKIEKLFLSKHKIKTFLGNMGERNILSIMPDIKKGLALMLFPYAFNKELRSQYLKYVFNGTNNKELLIDKILDFLVHEQKFKNIAVFAPNDELGQYLAGYVQQRLGIMKICPTIQVSYNLNHMEIITAAAALKKVGPDAVICLGDFMPSCRLISQFYRNNNLSSALENILEPRDALDVVQHDSPQTVFIGTEELFFSAKILENCLGNCRSNIFYTSFVPMPNKSKLNFKIVQEYLRNLKKFFPEEEVSPLGLSYYINAKLVTKILKERISSCNRRLSQDTLFNILFKGFSNIGYYDLGGFIASNAYGLRGSVYPLEPQIFNLRKQNKLNFTHYENGEK